MVKFYTWTHTYDYSFPAVSLAYFLRYPNPYSTHVLSEDVISRHFDPETQRLYTTRLQLKQSKLPAWILKLLPKNILGSNRGPNGEAQNYILEKSVVDINEGWMETETQNLQMTGVLEVIERQRYSRSISSSTNNGPASAATDTTSSSKDLDTTDVTTTVTFQSRLGQKIRRGDESVATAENEGERRGLFSWSTAGLRRVIEEKGLERTRNGLFNSKQGMTVVLERLRKGGLAAVLDGMRQDRKLVVGAVGNDHNVARPQARWQRIWREAQDDGEDVDV